MGLKCILGSSQWYKREGTGNVLTLGFPPTVAINTFIAVIITMGKGLYVGYDLVNYLTKATVSVGNPESLSLTVSAGTLKVSA